MHLPETPRQLAAGISASAAFLAAFLAMNFEWYIAGTMGAAVYGAIIALVDRKRETVELVLDAGITQADVDAAVASCTASAACLRELGDRCVNDRELADALRTISDITAAIAANYRKDPQDLVHSRGFVDFHLPKLLEVGKSYVDLTQQQLSVAAKQRLKPVREHVMAAVPRVHAILSACLENDFKRLELASSSLDQIMEAEVATDEPSLISKDGGKNA